MDTGLLSLPTRLVTSSVLIMYALQAYGQVGMKELDKTFSLIEFDSTIYIVSPDIEYDLEYFVGFTTGDLFMGYQEDSLLTVKCILSRGLDSLLENELRWNYDYLKDTCRSTREELYQNFQYTGVRIIFNDVDYFLYEEHLILGSFISTFNSMLGYCVKNGEYEVTESKK